MGLNTIDDATKRVAASVVAGFPDPSWQAIRYLSRWTPKGDVGADDFFVTREGVERPEFPRDVGATMAISRAAQDQLAVVEAAGQPRWYMMALRIDRSGKYSVDFTYFDNYVEGDIMKSVE